MPTGKVKKRRPITALERHRAGVKIWRRVCSEPWFEAVLYRAEQYPPGGDDTIMKTCQCPHCAGRRWWPPQCVGSNGWAYECWLAYEMPNLPGSHSIITWKSYRTTPSI